MEFCTQGEKCSMRAPPPESPRTFLAPSSESSTSWASSCHIVFYYRHDQITDLRAMCLGDHGDVEDSHFANVVDPTPDIHLTLASTELCGMTVHAWAASTILKDL